MRPRLLLALAVPLGLSACDSSIRPTLELRLASAGALCEPLTAPAAAETSVPSAPIAAGTPYVIVHRLPKDVDPTVKLALTIQTPCCTETLEVDHVGGCAIVERVAPPGADCSLVVTAAIQNSELVASTVTGACVAGACAAGCGSGAGGGGGGSGGGGGGGAGGS